MQHWNDQHSIFGIMLLCFLMHRLYHCACLQDCERPIKNAFWKSIGFQQSMKNRITITLHLFVHCFIWLFQWTYALIFSIQAPSNPFYKTLRSMLFRTSFPWLCSEIKLFLTKPAVDALRKLEVAAAVLVCGWSISYGSWYGTCTCAGCFTTKAPSYSITYYYDQQSA